MTRLPEQYAKILFELLRDTPKEKEKEAVHAYLEFLHREQALSKTAYILEAFERYAEEQMGIMNLRLTTARSMGEEERTQIKKLFGEKTILTEHVDEKVMGGIKIATRTAIIDATVQTRLQRLAHTLTT